MKRLSLYAFLFLMFSIFTSHSFEAKKHKIYKKLPCYFNGVKVGPSAQKDSGIKGGRCCVGCSAYKEKRGTSMEVRRGTPVVAITDMKVIQIEDSSSEQRSTSYAKEKYGVVVGKDFYSGGKEIIKPYDSLRIYFLDTNGNIILYYHLNETTLVPGFKKGKCKIPLEYEWGRKKMKPEDCGGYSEDLIKNNLNVKKGQVIGTSGHAYNSHFSLGIAVPADEGIKNYILETTKNTDINSYIATVKSDKDKLVSFKSRRQMTKSIAEDEAMKSCRLFFKVHGEQMQNSCYIEDVVVVKSIEGSEYGMKKEFYEKPYQFTKKYMKFTAPQRDFKWENLPTDSDAYLFPVMSKKYLKEIGYYN